MTAPLASFLFTAVDTGTASPTTVAAALTIPAPTIQQGAAGTPATVAATAAIGAPARLITVTPATVAGSTTIATPVRLVTMSPATVQATAAVATPARLVTMSPATVLGTSTVPIPPIIAGGDLEPPTIPANLHTTAVAATTADLAWDAATDNIGVTGYELQIVGP